MKVYRYMSRKEFDKMGVGIPMEYRGGSHASRRTNSIGFCFLPEEIVFSFEEDEDGCKVVGTRSITKKDGVYEVSYLPEGAEAFLSGLDENAILVEFEVNKDFEEVLKKGYGVYANPCTCGFYDRITITEYSTPYYDKYCLKPLRYSFKTDTWERWERRKQGLCEVEWYDFH